jgi:hypothetical protein
MQYLSNRHQLDVLYLAIKFQKYYLDFEIKYLIKNFTLTNS